MPEKVETESSVSEAQPVETNNDQNGEFGVDIGNQAYLYDVFGMLNQLLDTVKPERNCLCFSCNSFFCGCVCAAADGCAHIVDDDCTPSFSLLFCDCSFGGSSSYICRSFCGTFLCIWFLFLLFKSVFFCVCLVLIFLVLIFFYSNLFVFCIFCVLCFWIYF